MQIFRDLHRQRDTKFQGNHPHKSVFQRLALSLSLPPSLSMIITTRQKHQLSDLSLRLSLDGQNIENVTEHRLLCLIVDNKFRWQAQIEHICKSMSKKQLFLLSQLQHIVNIDTKELFYNAHIKPHIDYVSVVWDGCGEVHLKKLNSLHRRAGKLILPDLQSKR